MTTKIAAKTKKFTKAGATVEQCTHCDDTYLATFPGGKVVEFCENFQATLGGYDEASQETRRTFWRSPAQAIASALR